MLNLSEKLLLLGLHDEKGSVVFSASTALPYGLAGALLLDLYLLKRIEFADKQITLVSAEKTESDMLNEALELIAASEKEHDAKYWVKRVHGKVSKIQSRLAEQLVAKHILAREEHRFLWVFNFERYPTQNEQPEKALRAHLKDIVLNGAQAKDEDVALLSLVQACGLVTEIFDRADRKLAKQRIEELVKEQKISKAIIQTVDEVMAALMVVITATTVTTTVTS